MKKWTLSVERNGQLVKLNTKVTNEGKIGIPYLTEEQYINLGVYKVDVKKYGFFSAFPAGVKKAGEKLNFILISLK